VGRIGIKFGTFQYKELFVLTFERKLAFNSAFSLKRSILRGIFDNLSTSEMFAGHIYVIGGPDVTPA